MSFEGTPSIFFVNICHIWWAVSESPLFLHFEDTPSCFCPFRGIKKTRLIRWRISYQIKKIYVILKRIPLIYIKKLLDNSRWLEKVPLVPRILVPRMPIIYYFPKVHKNPLKPPGRPIVSDIDFVTSHIGKCIDFFLTTPWLVRPLPF